MSVPVTRELVVDRLANVVCPCAAAQHNSFNIVELGLVESIEIGEGIVDIDIRLTQPLCFQAAFIESEIEDHVGELAGVKEIRVVVDDGHEWSPALMEEDARRRRKEHLDTQLAK